MTFFNATLIFGVAAVAVPVVLHLIARREPRKVVFPSVRFLTKRFESNRSRLRVRRWWLLALRIAALAALAFALARPAIHQSLSVTWLTIGLVAALGIALFVLASVALSRQQPKAMIYGLVIAAFLSTIMATGWGLLTYGSGTTPSLGTAEPVAMAIILDNSATAAWKTPSDDRLSRMQDLASWMVTRLPRTSRIAVIDRSSQVASFSLDVASSISKIERIRPLEVTQPLSTRIDVATRLLRTSDLSNRQVLLITDLATATWNESMSDAGLAALLSEEPEVALTVFDLGGFDATNRVLSPPTFADNTPPPGVPIALTSTLTAQATEETTDSIAATVELELFTNDPSLPVVRDGKIVRPEAISVDRTNVRVAPGGSSELLMTIPSLDFGTHHGRIRVIGEDALPLDDVRYFTLEVLPPSTVLLVGDDEKEANIMKMAIIASPGLVDEENAEFQVERIGYTDLPAVRLSDFSAIVLLDPPSDVLRDRSLSNFAEAGGGILVALGPNAGTNALNETWTPELLRPWRAPDPGSFLQVLAANHPITQPLAKDTPWSDFRVLQYWQLKPGPSDRTLMTFAGTNHPALVERLVGQEAKSKDEAGRILTLATPLPALGEGTRGWNDLFGIDPWPAWLMTRQSIELLTRRGSSDPSVDVGSLVTIPIGDQLDLEKRPDRIQLFPPGDASPVPLTVPDDVEKITVTDVSRSGVYWIRGLESGVGFSANLDPSATQLTRIEPGELDQIFGPDQYNLVSDRESIELAENEASQRVSLHSPAILLVLVVFLLEQILGNRFYGRT
ncbi:MAG: BatA domain-containing protein [Planctomycetota bacterium]